MASRLLLLYNPAARHAPGPRMLARLEARIRWSGFGVDAVPSRARGDLARLAAGAGTAGYARVVVCGGDGSVREAAGGLCGSGVPLGLVPLGTANVLAREIGLPVCRPLECARIAATAAPRPVTPGEISGALFTFCASAGLDALAVDSVDLRMKHQTGGWAYLHAALRTLLERAVPVFRVELPGGERFEASQVFALKARRYGLGRLRLSRGADLASPTLRLLALDRPLARRLPVLLFGLLRGGVEGLPGVRALDVEAFRVAAADPMPVQADGDVVAVTPCEFRARPGALRLVAPP